MSTPPPDPNRDYPQSAADRGRAEPCPRRVRGHFGNRTVFDTLQARYVWEVPYYPQYYVPLADVDADLLVDEDNSRKLQFGTAHGHGLRAGDRERPGAARVYGDDAHESVAGHVRFEFDALDAWFEEDEQIFVHPRNPYARVDALRSHRHVRVELDGALLADSHSPVLVFETGLPTRYYLDRTDVVWEHLEPSDTQTACPYKGVTSGYWSVRVGADVHADLAWAYDYPTRQLLPVTGLVAFYNEKVDITVDGTPLPRPQTHLR